MAQPVLLCETLHNAQRIAHACESARRAGVRPGMTLAHARALLDGGACVVEEFDAAADAAMLRRLAVWAMRYSPVVAPDPPDGLLIDITGTQRLFGGEKPLLARIVRDLHRGGFHAMAASASNIGCAWAVARCGEKPIAMVPRGGEREALAPLSVRGLRIDTETIEALDELELGWIGQLLVLPRRDLAARYGLALIRRIDQALGRASETIDPVRTRPVPQVEREFDGPVTQIEAIEITVRELLQPLCDLMRTQERGIRRLMVTLHRVDAHPRTQHAMITLSAPNRDRRHLWSLLAPKVERLHMGFGVERVTLTVMRSAKLPHAQIERWPGAVSDAMTAGALGELLDTLAGRLGEDRLLRAQVVESHLAECACRMVAVASAPAAGSGLTPRVTEADRPTLLLPRPLPLDVETSFERPARVRWRGEALEVIACVGPERITEPWWNRVDAQATTRDYFCAQDERGRWLWLYRCHATGRWFLHGAWA